MGAVNDVQVAIDDVRFVVVPVPVIEGEELILDGNVWIGCGGDRREQVESAAEFLVEDGTGQVVAALRIAIQKEPAAQLLIRLVDRDVVPGHAGVSDEQRRGC
jgi:hypothetical protein